jgi:RNA polymerase sigma-70 factor (ECF subfamily)
MEGDARRDPSGKGREDPGLLDKRHRADDTELVRAARKGELAAFDRLVERYQRQATAVAFRLLNNLDDAMETVQDAFLNAYGKLGSLSDQSRFGPWLLRIVSNLSLNRRRSRMLRRTASLETVESEVEDRAEFNLPDASAIDPQAAASAQDVQRLIDQAMDELPEMQRQALVLFSIEEMPQKEVADILGCSVEAVKWHVFTARKRLKDKLKDYL